MYSPWVFPPSPPEKNYVCAYDSAFYIERSKCFVVKSKDNINRFTQGDKNKFGIMKYRVIRNDCRGFNNLSYTIHLRYQYMYFFLFNRTTLQVFVTYLTGALYVHPL